MRRLGLLHPTKVKLQLQLAIWQLVVASDELKLGQATANLYKGCFYCGIYLFYGRQRLQTRRLNLLTSLMGPSLVDQFLSKRVASAKMLPRTGIRTNDHFSLTLQIRSSWSNLCQARCLQSVPGSPIWLTPTAGGHQKEPWSSLA